MTALVNAGNHRRHNVAAGTVELAVTLVKDAAAWTALMAEAHYPHLPQSFAYGEGKRATGWTVKRVIFQRGERIIAFATVLERSLFGFRLVARVNRGPVFLAANPPKEEAIAIYAALRWHWPGPLLIAPALLWGADSDAILRLAGFRRRNDQAWISGRIDLLQSEAALYASFSSSFRNRVRKSEKLGATLRIADDVTSYEWMLARHVENMADKNFKGSSMTLLRAMREAFPQNVSVFQLMHDGKPVAGMSIVRFGQTAEYHIGWFGPEGRRLNAGNFLMWEAIKYLKAQGVSQFDIGGLRKGDGYTRFKQTMQPQEYILTGEWMSAWIPWSPR